MGAISGSLFETSSSSLYWVSKLQRLWCDSVNAPARLSLCCSHMWSVSFSCELAHFYLNRDMTKATKWLCAQQRLRSAWASAQSDQSSLSAWRDLGPLATHWAHSENSDQSGWMPRLIRVFAGSSLILLVLSWGGSFFSIFLRSFCWPTSCR